MIAIPFILLFANLFSATMVGMDSSLFIVSRKALKTAFTRRPLLSKSHGLPTPARGRPRAMLSADVIEEVLEKRLPSWLQSIKMPNTASLSIKETAIRPELERSAAAKLYFELVKSDLAIANDRWDSSVTKVEKAMERYQESLADLQNARKRRFRRPEEPDAPLLTLKNFRQVNPEKELALLQKVEQDRQQVFEAIDNVKLARLEIVAAEENFKRVGEFINPPVNDLPTNSATLSKNQEMIRKTFIQSR